MFKPFAAIVMSGVLAVTSLTATATQADTNEDLAKLLLGALIIYGIKEAVDDRNDRKTNPYVQPTPKPVVRNYKELPRTCIIHHRQHHGELRKVFGNRCLRNNFQHYAYLPDRCYRRFETLRGTRVGWGPRCLRREGYTW